MRTTAKSFASTQIGEWASEVLVWRVYRIREICPARRGINRAERDPDR
jgi:hypothetical protein